MNAVTLPKSHAVNSHVTSLIDGEGVALRAKGADIPVINPTTEETISQLREADAVLMLPGWHKSAGAKMEYDEARRLGMPIFSFTPIQDAYASLMTEGAANGH